jgi:high-affinity iron transporter
VGGQGGGPLAARLEPPPTDFTDRERALNRSVLGLFDAISYGIDNTAMTAFTQLSDRQRWSLAFYVGSLAFESATEPPVSPAISLQQMVVQNPGQLAAGLPEVQKQGVEWLRANPQRLFAEAPQPLAIARSRLTAGREAHRRGDYAAAADLAVSAYLDGFELAENTLDAHDKALRKDIEANMMRLRSLMSGPQSDGALDTTLAATLQQFDAAERLIAGSTLSAATLFTASLVILLREGLEALLVVIALMTILAKTERRDALRYVHLGWVAALLAGGATWVVAQSLITISGASRELMEGVAALLAALVLFYVGVWMHSKTHAAQWQDYIRRHIDTHLKSGTLWGLAALAFIAVYREVFETVLFYQSLLTQTVATHYSFVAGGAALGVVLLAVLAGLLIRYSVRLPIGRFFASTTYLLLALSFVLLGKAVLALQEADVIGISPLPVNFEIDWIGVKSTWQGILAQTLLVVAFMVMVIRSKLRAATP